MHYTAIIGAMDEEIAGLVEKMEEVQELTPGRMGFPLYSGKLSGKPVLVARCGIGKVNAALCTQYLIDHYPIKAIINSGVAGALSSEIRIGDLVISNAALHHDFDAIFFGYKKGVIPRMETSTFTADAELVRIAAEHGQAVMGPQRVHTGLVVSGDMFVAGSEQKQRILHDFPEAMCVEMEGSACCPCGVSESDTFCNSTGHV